MNPTLRTNEQSVRPAAAAGTFYPGDAQALLADVGEMLALTPE